MKKFLILLFLLKASFSLESTPKFNFNDLLKTINKMKARRGLNEFDKPTKSLKNIDRLRNELLPEFSKKISSN